MNTAKPTILLKTCNVNFHVPLNIFILFRKIPIGAEICRPFEDTSVSLRILGVRYRNQIRGSNMKVLKPSCTKKRIDFSNQCSITAFWSFKNDVSDKITTNCCIASSIDDCNDGYPSSNNRCVSLRTSGVVNFKVFNNSKIIITGMKEDNDLIRLIARMFIDIISPLTYNVTEITIADIMTFFHSMETFASFNYTHFEELLTLQDILEIKLPDSLQQFDYSPCTSLDTIMNTLDHDIIIQFYGTVMLCYMYGSQCMLNHCNNEVFRDIIRNHIFPIMIDYCTDNMTLSVENINAIIHFDYILDRTKFTRMINTIYPGMIASYDPSLYQGVNIKTSNNMTFLVFQEGKVLISGARTDDQLLDAAKVISRIIDDHRDELQIIVRPFSSFGTHPILRNPRNMYILQRLQFGSKNSDAN